jgi:hypothetical protein
MLTPNPDAADPVAKEDEVVEEVVEEDIVLPSSVSSVADPIR